MATKEVREVVKLCRSLGLEPVMESKSGHYKVRDPKSGAFVFGISSTPSDANWRWAVMRHLRRMGLLTRDEKGRKSRGFKRKSAIDLAALKRAQDAAASRGERIPMLEDLEDSLAILSKSAGRVGTTYTVAAQQEVIELMSLKSKDPRVVATRQRLRKLFDERSDELEKAGRDRQFAAVGHTRGQVKGKGAVVEFVRQAMYDQPRRDLRLWKSEASGQNGIKTFLEGAGVQVWVLELIEATMDHLDGLKFGVIDETRKRVPETQFPLPTPKQELYETLTETAEAHQAVADTATEIAESIKPEDQTWEPVEGKPEIVVVTTENHIRERYAEVLLAILEKEGSVVDGAVLDRLDKLAGIA